MREKFKWIDFQQWKFNKENREKQILILKARRKGFNVTLDRLLKLTEQKEKYGNTKEATKITQK